MEQMYMTNASEKLRMGECFRPLFLSLEASVKEPGLYAAAQRLRDSSGKPGQTPTKEGEGGFAADSPDRCSILHSSQ